MQYKRKWQSLNSHLQKRKFTIKKGMHLKLWNEMSSERKLSEEHWMKTQNSGRARENERICLLWLKKKNQVTAKQNTDFPRSSAADLAYRHYKTLQALGKAVSWAMLSLAQSPCKKQQIVLTLANKVGCSTSQSPNEFTKRKKVFLKKQRQLFLIFMRNLIWHGKNLANVTGSSEELVGKRSTYKRRTCSVLWEKLILLTCRLQ